MESLLEVEKEDVKDSARVTDEDREKDREIAFVGWSLGLILLGAVIAMPLVAFLLGPILLK